MQKDSAHCPWTQAKSEGGNREQTSRTHLSLCSLQVTTLTFIPSKRLSAPMEQGNPLLTEVNKLTDLITQRGHAGKNFNACFRKSLEELLTTKQWLAVQRREGRKVTDGDEAGSPASHTASLRAADSKAPGVQPGWPSLRPTIWVWGCLPLLLPPPPRHRPPRPRHLAGRQPVWLWQLAPLQLTLLNLHLPTPTRLVINLYLPQLTPCPRASQPALSNHLLSS